MKTAVCFPGQASFPMSDMLERFGQVPAVKPIVEEGLRFVDAIKTSVSDHTVQQLRTFIASVASYQIVREVGTPISVLAEHGVGFYASLVAAQAMSFSEGLEIIEMTGYLLDEVAQQGDYDMASIIGLSRDEINAICSVAAESGEVYLANINGPTWFVLSGHTIAVAAACDGAIRRGATEARLLAIGAPIHTNLLEHTSRRLRKQLATMTFQPPTTPIIEHIYAHRVVARNILDLLSQQLFMPVKWTRVMDVLYREGIDTFIELAPGGDLSRLIEVNREDATIISLGEPEALDEAIEQLSKLNP